MSSYLAINPAWASLRVPLIPVSSRMHRLQISFISHLCSPSQPSLKHRLIIGKTFARERQALQEPSEIRDESCVGMKVTRRCSWVRMALTSPRISGWELSPKKDALL